MQEDITLPFAEDLRNHIEEIAHDTLSGRIHSAKEYFTHNIISKHEEIGTTLSHGCYAPLLRQCLLNTPQSPY